MDHERVDDMSQATSAETQIAIFFLVMAIMAFVVLYCYRRWKTRKTHEIEATKDVTLVKTPDRTLNNTITSSKCSNLCSEKWKVEDFYLETLVFKSRDGRDVWRARLKNSCQRVNIQLCPYCDCVFVHKWTISYVITENYPIRTQEEAVFV